MGFPLKADYKTRSALCQLSFSDLNTICNVLNTIGITIVPASSLAEIKRPTASGIDWQIVIPCGSGLPSNAGKSKWMVPTLSADNATETDDPTLWTVDWIRAHA